MRRESSVKGDRVEIVIDIGDGTKTYEVSATRAGRRVDVADDFFRQDAAVGVFDGNPRRLQRLGMVQNEAEGVVNRQHRSYIARKARSISCPCSVRKLSG